MSYTPPAFNAVNFNFSSGGYTAPAHGAVNLSFGPPFFVLLQNATVSMTGAEQGWFTNLANAQVSITGFESGTAAVQLANAAVSMTGTSTPITSRKRRRIQICA